MRRPKNIFRKVVFTMSRAQKIRKEREEFLWSGKNLNALALYHSFLNMFEKVKFHRNQLIVTAYSYRGLVNLTYKGTLDTRTTVPYNEQIFTDLIDLFRAEEGYDAYYSNRKGEKDDKGDCVTVVMET